MAAITTLGFAGRTEEALAHYGEVLDAKTTFLMRFRDSPDQSHSMPGMEDMIFHATFQIEGTEFMASDVGYVDAEIEPVFAGFAIALRLESVEHGKRVFEGLANRGQVLIPLAKSAFTSWYGIVIDRFGVSWKIN
ncbi:MAG: VOC family protein, partial [Rubripirellula sp.]